MLTMAVAPGWPTGPRFSNCRVNCTLLLFFTHAGWAHVRSALEMQTAKVRLVVRSSPLTNKSENPVTSSVLRDFSPGG